MLVLPWVESFFSTPAQTASVLQLAYDYLDVPFHCKNWLISTLPPKMKMLQCLRRQQNFKQFIHQMTSQFHLHWF
ncbi:unnamed protein product [Aphanomyces euteiches]